MLAVYVAALALLVGSVCTAFAHTFIDLYAQPCEGLVDILLGSGYEALRVGVLDAEYHVATMTAGKQVVI